LWRALPLVSASSGFKSGLLLMMLLLLFVFQLDESAQNILVDLQDFRGGFAAWLVFLRRQAQGTRVAKDGALSEHTGADGNSDATEKADLRRVPAGTAYRFAHKRAKCQNFIEAGDRAAL
jgi:hypothetical protein